MQVKNISKYLNEKYTNYHHDQKHYLLYFTFYMTVRQISIKYIKCIYNTFITNVGIDSIYNIKTRHKLLNTIYYFTKIILKCNL